MGNAISISGTIYTIVGTVKNIANNEGVVDLLVSVYDEDLIGRDDFLGIGVTDSTGAFKITFDACKLRLENILDKKPDLYFIIEDGGYQLLNTKKSVIKNADASTPALNFTVDLSNDKLRKLINSVAVAGWVGGFKESNPAFAYPTPNLRSLAMLDNLANIPKLQRQQKVVWPEFSWETERGKADPKRCYQMFAPDISRLGYTNEGRVYSIICPQQGATSPLFGSINVEVTVTGNRGWVDETNKELAADMSVVGKIWFSSSAMEKPHVKQIFNHFSEKGLAFPFSKENAIKIITFNPKKPSDIIFPLTKGSSTDFPIPDFAKHEGIAWSLAHLGVLIGPIEKTGHVLVDKFNQLVLDIFNMASGNMLENGNTLTWNVWFTAPELVDQKEWTEHAEKWRKSINADHGSPDGDGTIARYFDGTPFKPLKRLLGKESLEGELLDEESFRIGAFIEEELL